MRPSALASYWARAAKPLAARWPALGPLCTRVWSPARAGAVAVVVKQHGRPGPDAHGFDAVTVQVEDQRVDAGGDPGAG
ncbi:MAG: hypothetical protein CVU30_13895 [Betaproteobacteria bacterium HGW-Betaproteobacteria-3]|nr:MAG: hypothetical protein CVU30_13895 [Betaproteobacteria bacterium HGW-Betaproteobacteria-3]